MKCNRLWKPLSAIYRNIIYISSEEMYFSTIARCSITEEILYLAAAIWTIRCLISIKEMYIRMSPKKVNSILTNIFVRTDTSL